MNINWLTKKAIIYFFSVSEAQSDMECSTQQIRSQAAQMWDERK